MLGSGHAMCLVWGDGRTLIYNDAYAPLLGDRHPEALGKHLADVWPEIWDEIAHLVDRTFAGESLTFENMPLVMTRRGAPEETWWSFSYSPVHSEDGRVAGLLNVTFEATAHVLAERDRDVAVDSLALLNEELSHRLKNLLAVVQSITHQTLHNAIDCRAASHKLSGRLVALGAATDLLTASSWRSADLKDLVVGALAPHGEIGRRIQIDGASLILKSDVAVAIVLALHELATNAAKYGALSNETGTVRLAWWNSQAGADEGLSLRWEEVGGPTVAVPEHRGFGTALIERSLRSYVRGQAATEYRPSGVVFRMNARLADIVPA